MQFDNTSWTPVFDNSLDAFVPEVWAQEALMQLENNMVAGNLVYRDFENSVQAYGDVVNTRRPSGFTAKRKTDSDDVTLQNAEATNVQVPLNQLLHTSFIVKDGEQSKGFQNLVTTYLVPAARSLATAVDQITLGQVYRFRTNNSGKLGTTPTRQSVLEARAVMNTNKAPMEQRSFIVTPNAEASLLNIDGFINAEKVGDNGTALREASLGRKLGYNFYMCQACPSIAAGNSTTTTALTAAAAAGATSLAVTAFAGGGHPVGAYLTVAGDMTPQRITAIDADAETITISPGLKYAASSSAVVTIYTPGAVNLGAGYSSGYSKTIVTDTFTVAPKSGQLAAFGTATGEFASIGTPTTTALDLDIPLTADVANDAAVNIGPAGDYCFAFHKEALALVVRPLALPMAGAGALSHVASYNGLSMRVTISYDGYRHGHLVTLDMLCGVKVLNTSLGAVMYC